MRTLFILNDPPYGTDRCYDALCLASTLLKNDPEVRITVFLMDELAAATVEADKLLVF